jgi:hypothetical protein
MECVREACRAVEGVLAQGEPDPTDLAPLQELLEDEDRHPAVRIALRGERAVVHAQLEGLANRPISLPDVDGELSAADDRAWRSRCNPRVEHPLLLGLLTRWVELTDLPLHEQIPAEKSLDAETRALRVERAPLAGLLVRDLGKIGEKGRLTHAHLRCLLALLAAERHRRAKGDWPASLAKVPLDPFDGKPLRYRRLPDGVGVYSSAADVAYRLRDVGRRRR